MIIPVKEYTAHTAETFGLLAGSGSDASGSNGSRQWWRWRSIGPHLLRPAWAVQAPRWRPIVVWALAVSCLLALFQGLLYLSYGAAHQQAATGQGEHVYRWRIAGHDLALSVNQAGSSTSGGNVDASGNADAGADAGRAGSSTAGGTAEQAAVEQPAPQEPARETEQQQQPSAGSEQTVARQPDQVLNAGAADAGSSSSSSAGLACRESGLCSVGKVRRWRGDIATNEQLRAMLEAVSYKREVGRESQMLWRCCWAPLRTLASRPPKPCSVSLLAPSPALPALPCR